MKNKILFRTKTFFVFALLISLVFAAQISSAFAQKKASAKRKTIAAEKAQPENFAVAEREIFRLVNRERRKRNLNELEWNADLAEMARKYSEKMADENFFSHFDLQGANVAKRAQKARIKGWTRIGENLFTIENYSSFDRFAVKAWMNSPSHRQNILDKDWTTTGVGVAQADNGDVYITQVFIER